QGGLGDAEIGGQAHGFGDQADLGGEQGVVHQFHAVARAERADVDDRVGVGGQDGAGPGDGGVVAADHDGEPAGGDVVRAAAAGSVGHQDIIRGGRGEGGRGVGAAGGVHDEHRRSEEHTSELQS